MKVDFLKKLNTYIAIKNGESITKTELNENPYIQLLLLKILGQKKDIISKNFFEDANIEYDQTIKRLRNLISKMKMVLK